MFAGSIGVAHRIEELVRELYGIELPIGLTAWDGSVAGPDGEPRVLLRSRRALRHLLWQPGELGLARAFVSGDLDVRGDLGEGLRRCWATARDQELGPVRLGARGWLRLVSAALRLGAVGPRPAPPAGEARLSGGLHSRNRDRSAIAHHYDAGNEFYELLLDPRMAYSCGYYTDGELPLAAAQEEKLDLVCRKLGLTSGMRLLDVGCGWGSLILYAAQRYGVRATGVTLSGRQAEHIRCRVAQFGLREQVEVLHRDYREIDAPPFDAIASIEMGEHVGTGNYPVFAATLHRMLRPGGRLLLQQMSRGGTAPGGGAFIEAYIAPDMAMVPIGRTLDYLEQAGLEVRDVEGMREHYVRTVRDWTRTLRDRWDDAVGMVGVEQARVWRLYLAGGALAFEENRMGVNQILAVRAGTDGDSGLPLVSRESLLRTAGKG
ncbi:SAM-dependent methyltransferase [Saccharopolyspora spinosa]|uniref:Cyclopropane-fatty-acyl-phospholipid synthase n=1 Tax=Saccharopolyspora spinosa TaxID=60894 RepID=A0A2N3XVA9_SACSN|nr:cyclopropane-fatty-acyl-phospholipid synthase family protein [Saccharopolyspora spinosa]PKW14596.1 cyclopropane-fatty-acyl-phospholipid synthase [Saccharopolyspora spinosa]